MWNNFVPTFSEEETVSHSFCRSSLFKITSNEQVTESPALVAVVQNKKMLVAVDSSLVLLEDENVMECKFLSFEASIDSLCVSSNGNLIICALANGSVHGVYIKGVPVFELLIETDDIAEDANNEDLSKKTFAGIQQIGENYSLMCTNGALYSLSNVDENNLNESLLKIDENETCVFEQTLLNSAVLERIISAKVGYPLETFALYPQYVATKTAQSNFIAIAGSKDRIIIQTPSQQSVVSLPDKFGGIKKLVIIDNFMIGLSHHGELFEICPFTELLFVYPMQGQLLEDLIVIENNEDEIELLVLTKANTEGIELMKIISFPSMKCSYELEVSGHTWLVNQSKSSGNIYYMSGSSGSELSDEIEMKMISQTSPSQRLAKIIQCGHLNEAEQFAKEFNLSLQPIFEARVKHIILKIGSTFHNDEEEARTQFEILIKTMGLIEDHQFLISLRLLEIPTPDLLERFLRFLQDTLQEKDNQSYLTEINEQLLRLETLRIVDPYNCKIEWENFVYSPKLKKSATELLLTMDMSSVSLIWARHSASIIPYLNVHEIDKALTAIPEKTTPFQLIVWLKHFVPSVLQTHPNAMTTIVDWSIDRTRSLQQSLLWPEIGLEFANNILSIFSGMKFLFPDIRRHYDTNIEKIQILVNALQDLSVLKKSYHLTLQLSDYLKEEPLEAAFKILHRVQLIHLKSIVMDFLFPILMEKGFSPVSAIIRYVKFLATKRTTAQWQERCVVAIELLHNEDEKLQSVLLVLKAAPVPWSEDLSPLVKYRNSGHPLAAKIQNEFELQTLKIVKIKYDWPLNNSNNERLAARIIYKNFPEMCTDIIEVVKSSPEKAQQIYFYCLQHLARHGRMCEAIKFMLQIEKTQHSLNSSQCILLLELMIEQELPQAIEHVESLYELMRHVASKENENPKANDFGRVYRKFLLRSRFNIIVKQFRTGIEYLNDGIKSIIERLQRNETDFYQNMLADVEMLCLCLDVELTTGLYVISTMLESVYLSCAVANTILDIVIIAENNYEHLIDFVFLIVTQQFQILERKLSDHRDPLAFPLCERLLCEALKYCTENTSEILALLKWIRIVSRLYGKDAIKDHYEVQNVNSLSDMLVEYEEPSNEVFSKKLLFTSTLSQTEQSKTTCDPITAIKSIMAAMKLVICCLENVEVPICRFAPYFKEELKNTSEQEVSYEFFGSIELLLKQGQYLTAFAIVQKTILIQRSCTKEIIHESYEDLINKKVLKQILSRKDANFLNAVAILLASSDPQNCLDHVEQKFKKGHHRSNYLKLTEFYSTLTGDTSKMLLEKENRLTFTYCMEICKSSGVSLKASGVPGDVDAVSVKFILKELRRKSVDIHILERMSKDFGWDFQEVLMLQLITILSLQELDFGTTMDAFGKEEILIRTTVASIKKVCQPYVCRITNSDLLVKKLTEYLVKINFYFYELYLYVIDVIDEISQLSNEMELWKSILLFLSQKMTTKRFSRVNQLETDYWLKTQSEKGVLPKIAKYRLPFVPILKESLKDILNDEVRVENCNLWFPLIKMKMALNVGKTGIAEDVVKTQDYFCMSAAKNSISEYVAQSEHTGDDVWNLQPIRNSFLQSILRLISHIHDVSKKLFILYFVTNNAPEGADQVEAAFECYKLGKMYETELNGNQKGLDTVAKIKRKYPIFKTQHLLHVYNLPEDKLFHLIESPVELINALYNHESILKKQKPDINKLVNELAELHGINIEEIQSQLLAKWLTFSFSNGEREPNETFYDGDITNMSVLGDTEMINDEFVTRAHFILSSWDSNRSLEFLMSYLDASENTTCNETQLQVFECFTKLIDESTVSQGDIIEQSHYIALKCIHLLKQFGIVLTIEKFETADKLDLLKKIWNVCGTNERGLELLVYICLGSNMFNSQIWDGILRQMVNLKMMKHIEALVDLLSAKSSLLHIDGITKAWQMVIEAPFFGASKAKSYEQETALAKSLIRLQTCPVVLKLDLVPTAEQCIFLDRPHVAAMFIVFAKPAQANIIKEMVLNNRTATLKQDIRDLEEHGVVPIVTNFMINTLGLK